MFGLCVSNRFSERLTLVTSMLMLRKQLLSKIRSMSKQRPPTSSGGLLCGDRFSHPTRVRPSADVNRPGSIGSRPALFSASSAPSHPSSRPLLAGFVEEIRRRFRYRGVAGCNPLPTESTTDASALSFVPNSSFSISMFRDFSGGYAAVRGVLDGGHRRPLPFVLPITTDRQPSSPRTDALARRRLIVREQCNDTQGV